MHEIISHSILEYWRLKQVPSRMIVEDLVYGTNTSDTVRRTVPRTVRYPHECVPPATHCDTEVTHSRHALFIELIELTALHKVRSTAELSKSGPCQARRYGRQ